MMPAGVQLLGGTQRLENGSLISGGIQLAELIREPQPGDGPPYCLKGAVFASTQTGCLLHTRSTRVDAVKLTRMPDSDGAARDVRAKRAPRR